MTLFPIFITQQIWVINLLFDIIAIHQVCYRGTFPQRDNSYQHCVTSVIALAIAFIAQWGPGLKKFIK